MLYPLINRPTRVTTHSATIIDNIFTGQSHDNVTSGFIIDDISDHFAILTLFKTDISRVINSEHICKRNLFDVNIDRMCNYLGDYHGTVF